MASIQCSALGLTQIHSLVLMLYINDTLLTLIFSRIYLYLVTNQYKIGENSPSLSSGFVTNGCLMWILRGCELSFYTRLPLCAPDCCVNDCPDAGQETSEDNHDDEEEAAGRVPGRKQRYGDTVRSDGCPGDVWLVRRIVSSTSRSVFVLRSPVASGCIMILERAIMRNQF